MSRTGIFMPVQRSGAPLLFTCVCVVFLHCTALAVVTSDKGGGKCVFLSVCLLARLLKNACMDLDEMLHADRCCDMDELINF